MQKMLLVLGGWGYDAILWTVRNLRAQAGVSGVRERPVLFGWVVGLRHGRPGASDPLLPLRLAGIRVRWLQPAVGHEDRRG